MTPDDERTVADTSVADTAAAAPHGSDTEATGQTRRVTLPEPGYTIGELLGRGGMGEVVRAHDRRIGRDVAIKRMRQATPSDEAVQRFLREARIQGRLDHPAIVPVYELGLDAAGQPYFAMKQLAGTTLATHMSDGTPLPRLLRGFVEVCLAIQFAHERGVVHRDLKPANIILGEYGEVYVLDWGIARVIADPHSPPPIARDIDTLDGGTQTGEMIGTPGYMAPEQVRGIDVVTPATDVYALGSILFELLAGEPLHPRGVAAIASTLGAAQQAPRTRPRARDLAPELDAACLSALAEDPAARPTARALGERIQRYLDGDRDVAQRRTLAAERLQSAAENLASGDPERRPLAMREAGYALALDPTSEPAARVVSSMILEPPRVLPAALERALADEDRRIGAERINAALRAVGSVLSLTLLLPFMEVRDWGTVGMTLAALAGSFVMILGVRRRGAAPPWLTTVVGLVLVFAFSRVLGVFVLTPTVIAVATFVVTANSWLSRHSVALVAWLLAAVLGPLALEWGGVYRRC
jgi:eukaryotic-like serine/threonine-protein kinase